MLCASSVAQTVYELKGAMIGDIGPLELSILWAKGAVLQQNRDDLIDAAMSEEADKLLFVDDDMAFNHKAVVSLISRQLPVVFANYPIKTIPIGWTAKQVDKRSDLITTEESTGLEEAAFGGFGLSLIDTKLIAAVEKPRFLLGYNKKSGLYSTEDYILYDRIPVKKYVDHDASKLVGHVGQFVYRYSTT